MVCRAGEAPAYRHGPDPVALEEGLGLQKMGVKTFLMHPQHVGENQDITADAKQNYDYPVKRL
jgi:hypothetical protein